MADDNLRIDPVHFYVTINNFSNRSITRIMITLLKQLGSGGVM